MRKTIICLGTLAASAFIGSPAAFAALPIPALPSPSAFVSRVDNPWFPLTPGTVYRYRGVKDGKPAVDVLTVTHLVDVIRGISATVLHDKLYLNGTLAERTTDWYAQDKRGSVWYLGEKTATLDARGRVKSTDGTWKAGVGGAKAGIFMPGHPFVGEQARQEYFKGHAEDQFKVLNLSTRITTPGASSRHALLTQETTRLEPGVVDHKFYVKGVGTVLEVAVRGGTERLTLVSVTGP
jgi:hypothetical protein